ncbi:MAG: CocE/NonD family hydrolase [Clostridia bacterium]|nr:CocE/NonD family hydrolase [Clostridia bacterium]
MDHVSRVEYLEFDGDRFFTVILLPQKDGAFPTVAFRTPYARAALEMTDRAVEEECLRSYDTWLDRGYAVVFQHCRGQGKSTGAFVPYIHEREDGLALREWIRKQPFYNGEIFLCGASYGASLHYATAPFESDVKGAVLEVQDSERYRLWYRNGQMRKGHANWHFGLYKSKCGLNKSFSKESFSQLPLQGLSERVLHDRAEDFEQMLLAPDPADPFWNTRFGGADARNATDQTPVPLLLTTGYQDYYVGGLFRMWERMSEETRKNCALLVSPYDHGDRFDEQTGLAFPGGKRTERFGKTYRIDWFDHIRKGTALPYKKGEITYYRAFENVWRGDFYETPVRPLEIPLGRGAVTLRYDPLDPPAFPPEGTFSPPCRARADVASVDLPPAERDLFVKGRIEAELAVRCDCPDTTFLLRIFIKKPQGDYALRHDITSICRQAGDTAPGSEVLLRFCFDEIAFLLKKGERLRIDIAPTDHNVYIRHTNQKGPYALQSKTAVARSEIDLARSRLILPVEEA